MCMSLVKRLCNTVYMQGYEISRHERLTVDISRISMEELVHVCPLHISLWIVFYFSVRNK